MPKGVYDRSKSRDQRANDKAEVKVAKVAKAEKIGKRKYTKRAVSAVEAIAEAQKDSPITRVNALGRYEDTQLFITFSNSLASLANTHLHAKMVSKLEALIERLEPTAKPLEKVEKAERVEKVEKKAEAVSAPIPSPISSLPVPIPVPVPFNGTNPQ